MSRGVYQDPPGSDWSPDDPNEGFWDENESDEALDPEGPSAGALARFGGASRDCPSCGTEVYEDAPLCHVCGHALETPRKAMPAWMVITAVVAVLLILAMFVF